MDERERFEAQREAKREAAGTPNKATRDRLWGGLSKYLTVEAALARKAARAESEKGRHRRST